MPSGDLSIAASTIGAIGVIGAAVINRVDLTKWISPKNYEKRKAISGNWYGQISQGNMKAYYIMIEIIIKGPRICGVGAIQGKGEVKVIHLKMDIDMPGGNIMRFRYKPKDKAANGHGVMLLKLDTLKKTMEGKFVGLGIVTDQITNGTISMSQSSDKFLLD